MKKLFGFIAVLMLIFTLSALAQETAILKADSISNSQTKIHYVDISRFGTFDSVAFNVYAMGEIDLDSLDIDGGIYVKQVVYKGSNVTGINLYEAIEGATMTVNNDSASATYVQGIATVTKAEAQGYNRLKVSLISASSGNDATDPTQKYILAMTVYR